MLDKTGLEHAHKSCLLQVVGPSLVLWPLLSLLGPVLASSVGPGARLETVLGPSSLLVRPYRGGFTLSLELEGERQVFHLSQRQQRARLWLAGEQGNLTDVHQQVTGDSYHTLQNSL